MVSTVVKDTPRFVDEKTVPMDEVRAMEKPLQKKPPQTVRAHFCEPARELTLPAE
jgi:hypothetical protein